MSHPIDVGSVLGGRYKVTATVLTSHDHDLVLDGVDQVLNRPVSILVAGPDNAEQVAQSAREVATGERPGNVQILDLGVSDSTTYLITNHTSAADLLDLVVASNPPYVEPFFTDTLGSEIFGQARSHEPETYDGLYDEEEVDAGYINYGNNQPASQDRQTVDAPGGAASRCTGAPVVGALPWLLRRRCCQWTRTRCRGCSRRCGRCRRACCRSGGGQIVQGSFHRTPGDHPAAGRPRRPAHRRQRPAHRGTPKRYRPRPRLRNLQRCPCGPTMTTTTGMTAAPCHRARQDGAGAHGRHFPGFCPKRSGRRDRRILRRR